MPRNSSGVYTLPAGNPVVAFTTITTAWANPTMADIGNELTNSLDRQGRGGMLAPFRIFDGNISQPGLGFLNEVGLGLWRASAGLMHIVNSGVNVISVHNDRVVFPVTVQIFDDTQYRQIGFKNWQVINDGGFLALIPSATINGSDWNPALATTWNPDTGMPSFPVVPGSGYVRITGDTMTGDLVINKASPRLQLLAPNATTGPNILFGQSGAVGWLAAITPTAGDWYIEVETGQRAMTIVRSALNIASVQFPNGNVGIGKAPTKRLDVAGQVAIGAASGESSTIWANFPDGTRFASIDLRDLATGAMIFKPGGAFPAWFDSNVGIGAAPSQRLTVRSAATGALPVLGTGSGIASFLADTGLYGLYEGFDSATGASWLQAMRNDAATAYAIILNPSGGNVGIGAAPGATLHVQLPNSTGTSAVRAASSGTVSPIFSSFITGVADWAFGQQSGTGNFLFSVNPTDYTAAALAAAARMTITGSGNVGIGVTPTYKLDVAEGSGAEIVSKFTSQASTGPDYTASIFIGQAIAAAAGAQFGHHYNAGTPTSSFTHITPWGAAKGSQFKINYAGDVSISEGGGNTRFGGHVGIGGSPVSRLTVKGGGMQMGKFGIGSNPELLIGLDNAVARIVNGWGAPSNPGLIVGTSRVDGLAFQVRSGVSLDGNSLPTDSGNNLLLVNGDGRIFVNAIHNNAASAGGATPMLASGTYTPVATNLGVNTQVATPEVAQWMRVGKVVTVSVAISIKTAAAGVLSFTISLPAVAGAFTNTIQACGSFVDQGSVMTKSGGISAVIGGLQANFVGTTASAAATTAWATFTYLVI